MIIVETSEALASGAGSGPAAAPLDDSSAPANPPATEVLPPSSGGISPLLWGGAALAAAAAATAYALDRRKKHMAEIERMRQVLLASSSPEALQARLDRLRRQAEVSIAPAQAAALEIALKAQTQTASSGEAANAMNIEDVQRLRTRLGELEAPDLSTNQLAERERLIAELQSRLPEEASLDVPRQVDIEDGEARPVFRSPDRIVADGIREGIGIAEVIGSLGAVAYSATQVKVVPMGNELRIYGPRAARSQIGFNPYTNTIGAQNEGRILQSPFSRRVSPGWAIVGIVSNIGYNTYMHFSGQYDRFEYASALTVDTGATAAAALSAGFIAGATAGAIVGLGVASLPAAIIGGAVGAIASFAAFAAFDRSGARGYLVEKVADFYSGGKRP